MVFAYYSIHFCKIPHFFEKNTKIFIFLHIHNDYGADYAQHTHYKVKVTGDIILSALMYSVKENGTRNHQNKNAEKQRSMKLKEHCNNKCKERNH